MDFSPLAPPPSCYWIAASVASQWSWVEATGGFSGCGAASPESLSVAQCSSASTMTGETFPRVGQVDTVHWSEEPVGGCGGFGGRFHIS